MGCVRMENYDYLYIDCIDAKIRKRIDAFLTICKVLNYDDIELYISANSIIENLIRNLYSKGNYSTTCDEESLTYFEILNNPKFLNYLNSLGLDMNLIHKVRMIRNTQHNFSDSNSYLETEVIVKAIFDIATIVYNSFGNSKVKFILDSEVSSLLGEKIGNEPNKNESFDEINEVLSEAVDTLFTNSDIDEILAKENKTNTIDSINTQVKAESPQKLKVRQINKCKVSRELFLQLIKEKKKISMQDKKDYKKSSKMRRLELESSFVNLTSNNPKYMEVIKRGYVIKGELSSITTVVKDKFHKLIKLAKTKKILKPGFPSSAYDSALWKVEYLKNNILIFNDVLEPICFDVTLVCNMMLIKHSREMNADPYNVYLIAVDLCERIDSAATKIKNYKPKKK